jgi:hypothetical protein
MAPATVFLKDFDKFWGKKESCAIKQFGIVIYNYLQKSRGLNFGKHYHYKHFPSLIFTMCLGPSGALKCILLYERNLQVKNLVFDL